MMRIYMKSLIIKTLQTNSYLVDDIQAPEFMVSIWKECRYFVNSHHSISTSCSHQCITGIQMDEEQKYRGDTSGTVKQKSNTPKER